MKKISVGIVCMVLIVGAFLFLKPVNVEAYAPVDPVSYLILGPDPCDVDPMTPGCPQFCALYPEHPECPGGPICILPVGPGYWVRVPDAPRHKGPADGNWEALKETVSGAGITRVKITADSPNDWSILLSDGFAVDGSTQLCHPFNGGQSGWQASIYLLSGGSWIELPTTISWVADEESQMQICAFAPMSGTYAIYGFIE